MKRILILILLFICYYSGKAQNFEWASQFSGTAEVYGRTVEVDSDGNTYLAGRYEGTVDFDPGPGVFNMSAVWLFDSFIVKIDSSGNFVWARSIGGMGMNECVSLTLDKYGNIYLTGYFTGTTDFDPGVGLYNLTSVGGDDIFVLKLDSNGLFNWAYRFGGPTRDQGHSIASDKWGNIYISGWFSSDIDFDPDTGIFFIAPIIFGGWDIFILKLDINGNFIWVKQFGGPGTKLCRDITIDNWGNVITTGRFTGTIDFDPGINIYNLNSVGNEDIFISKLDNSGNFVWAKSIGSSNTDIAHSITTDGMGNIYTTGEFWGAADFDPGPGTFILTATDNDAFISKLDSSGNFSWAISTTGTGNAIGYSISTDIIGNVYTTGRYAGTVDFDPDSTVFNLYSYGVYISKYLNSGSFEWVLTTGGTGNTFGVSIFIDSLFNIYVGGYFSGVVDFDPNLGMYNLTASGVDAFALKLAQCSPPLISISSVGVNLCPGDTSVSATVNATGNAPFTYAWSNGQITQTATGLVAGTYTVLVIDDSSCASLATVTVTDPPATVSNISSTPSNFNSPNCNGSVSINPTGGTPPYNISWNSGTTTNLCEGWYTATITDANGCIDTDSVYVDFVTGIEELNAAGIFVYPNPVNDILTINSEKEIGAIKIYDVLGKLIYHKLIKSNNAEIDVKELNSGIYFLEAENYRGKFVKE